MRRNQKLSEGGIVIMLSVLLTAVMVEHGYVDNAKWLYGLLLSLPLLAAAIYFYGKKHS